MPLTSLSCRSGPGRQETGLHLGLVGEFGVALGALVRSTAGGIAILTGVLVILSDLTGGSAGW
ncbi:hypothetical protein [Streptomyces sp. AC555_RSS877]|uniref:hypothetical protein n=1 Tax=Streptomyces sp. AC555_RSS877 TaxID=2823688 RepID=UPI001C26C895|nr:hypothetical protein [Streptomyces sp. AC555_RSS877]